MARQRAFAVLTLLDHHGLDLAGRTAAVVGRSLVVGTPVPGGVGPVITALLLANTVAVASVLDAHSRVESGGLVGSGCG